MTDSQTVNMGVFWKKGKGAGKRTPYYIIKGKKEELHGFPIPSPYHPVTALSTGRASDPASSSVSAAFARAERYHVPIVTNSKAWPLGTKCSTRWRMA